MAYGEPLDPKKTTFELYINDGSDNTCAEDGGIGLFLTDDEAEDNDDVRDVIHPDFETYWDNDMENTFSTTHFTTLKEAEKWLRSIGMHGSIRHGCKDPDISKGEKPRSKYGNRSVQELKCILKTYEFEENYEKCAEIQLEITERENKA
jgi:hypothetical protein